MSQIVSDLTHITRCCGQYRNRLLESLGLTTRQASLLREICAAPGISQDALSRKVFLNKSVVARQLAALEEEGFVERRASQKDKRVTQLHPTEKTLQMQPQLQAIAMECENFLTKGMTEAEIDALEAVLSRLQTRAALMVEVEG